MGASAGGVERGCSVAVASGGAGFGAGAAGGEVVSVKIQQKARVKDEERKCIVVDSGGKLGG